MTVGIVFPVCYLLFVEQHSPADHDLRVTDYIACYLSIGECKQRYTNMHPHVTDYVPFALIARFDGDTLVVAQRYDWKWVNNKRQLKWREVGGDDDN